MPGCLGNGESFPHDFSEISVALDRDYYINKSKQHNTPKKAQKAYGKVLTK